MSIVGLARATNGWKLVSDCAAERLTQGVGLLSCSNACSVSMYIWIVLAFKLAPVYLHLCLPFDLHIAYLALLRD